MARSALARWDNCTAVRARRRCNPQALEHQQLTHPLYKSVSEVISCGDEGEKLIATRIPLDPADAVLDEDGFRHVPTEMVHHGLKVEVGRYPLWGTTLVDMGRIGGAGSS